MGRFGFERGIGSAGVVQGEGGGERWIALVDHHDCSAIDDEAGLVQSVVISIRLERK
jgi:hypothetical protein